MTKTKSQIIGGDRMKKGIIKRRLRKHSFTYSEHWGNEVIELSDSSDGLQHNNALYLTKREVKALQRFLNEVLNEK